MLMRGDLQKIFDQVNPVFETAFNRIDALEARLAELEGAPQAAEEPKKPRGRPPGSKNKPKAA